MGKVYSWEEINSNQVPYLSDYIKVGDMLKKKLSESPVIMGALLCGSFLRGDHNIRSDIDCVVIYNWEERQNAMELFQELNMFASGFKIPLELIPLDTELAQTSYHPIPSTFLEHLRISAEDSGTIKKSPIELIKPSPMTFVEDTNLYLINKIRKLEKGTITLLTDSAERLYFFLQKVLELPSYTARKVLRCHGETFSHGDSNFEVLRMYAELGLDKENKILQEVTELNRQYSQVLGRRTNQSEVEYTKIIDEIKNIIPVVLDFARLNLTELQNIH